MRFPWTLVVPAAAGFSLAACGSNHPGSSPPSGPASVPTQIPASTTQPPAPTTTVFKPSAPQSSPDGAAGLLISAWSEGNRSKAGNVAGPTAVAALFAVAYPTGYLQSRGCTDPSTNPGTCTYRNTKTDAIYEVTVVQGPSGWYVTAVTPEM